MSLIGKRLGNYDIQGKLGEGGMGIVYMGVHPQIGKKVAVKVLHPELSDKADVVTRFFNEAKAVNDINHPNIVDIIDFGESTVDGVTFKYIMMEFLDGESLSARMRREGVTIRESISILAQCCSALSASHGKGVVHRDLKPENIFLVNRPNDRNYIKLLDFGIAKLTTEDGAMSQKTRTGMVIGTPTYMSPEQCDGKGNIDHRADIYALGIVMYELLTGKVPFPGEGFGEVLVAHLTREPDPPRTINPNIPAELEAIVMRCLRKKKEERFQSMNDMQLALVDPMPHYQAWMSGQPAPRASGPVPLPGSGSVMMSAAMMPSGSIPGMMGPMQSGVVNPGQSGMMRPAGQSGVMQQGQQGMMPQAAMSHPGQYGQPNWQQQGQMQQGQMQQGQMQQGQMQQGQMQQGQMYPQQMQQGQMYPQQMQQGQMYPQQQMQQGHPMASGVMQPGQMQAMMQGHPMASGVMQPGQMQAMMQGHPMASGVMQPGQMQGMMQPGQMQQHGMMPGSPMASGVVQAPMPQSPSLSQSQRTGQTPSTPQPSASADLQASPAAQSGARSMTLSGASGEAASRRKPATVLIGLFSAMLIGSMSMVSVKYLRGTPQPVVAMPRPAAQVTISVKTEPADAEIEQDGPDGKALHKAPYTFMVKKDSGEVSLKIRAAGYQEESRVLHPSEDQNIEITLAKQEKPVEPATVDTGSTPKTKPEVAVKEGKPVKEPKEVAVKEPKEAKPVKEPKAVAVKEPKAVAVKEPKEAKPVKEPKAVAVKEPKEAKPAKEPKEPKGPKKKKEDLLAPVF